MTSLEPSRTTGHSHPSKLEELERVQEPMPRRRGTQDHERARRSPSRSRPVRASSRSRSAREGGRRLAAAGVRLPSRDIKQSEAIHPREDTAARHWTRVIDQGRGPATPYAKGRQSQNWCAVTDI